MRSAIFDLDGTLVDTSADLMAAANAVFADWGLAARLGPEDAVTAFGGGRAMLRAGLARAGLSADETRVDAGFAPFVAHYRAKIDRFSTVYEGVEDTLASLQAQGWKLGICTNKPQDLADMLLGRLKLARFFPVVIGADALAVRKPHPLHLTETISRLGGDARRAVLVGDTVTDYDTAKAANLPSILVTFGPNAAACRALNPTALLESYADLPPILERLVPA
ncbi:HAD-IA family hydrolase [Abyssibius alkaniclasticus]|uniref:HAD-IA family hydrolase n=1 Tax=Abyssibius alkaniclasticus TaxID=2881234 RepID=UPI002363B1CC|nr:HAD-IA family hydrolase [Abyssibius alkaniclasticus]UPH70978.1 HAD-IA family hydrolase [Abyssibius alkaniclasticus]